MNDGEYLDGQKHGLWITYYANGNKRGEGSYDRGRKEGEWIQYWPNGSKKSVATFIEDRFTGLYMAYHDNGNRATQGYYNEHQTKEGPWTFYETDGETVWRIVTYHHGSRSKPDELFRPAGHPPDHQEE